MKISKLVVALSAAFVGSVAMAAPISLVPGPLYIQWSNAEQASLTNNIGNTSGTAATWSEGNWGLIRVTSIGSGEVLTPNADIGAPNGANFFNNQVQGQITGIFYGINFTDATGTKASGGFLDLYWDDLGGTMVNTATELTGGVANIALKRTAQDQYTGFTDGTFLARLEFKPGIGTNAADAATTVSSTNSPVTGNGDANSYQSVVVGATNYNGQTGLWANQLNSDWFKTDPASGLPLIAGVQDFFTKSSFNQNNSWDGAGITGIQGLSSSDPGRAFALPEPGSIALVGIALFGLGFAGRRRA